MARTHKIKGQRRVVIDRVRPEVDGGHFPAKRVVGDTFTVDAEIVADGHDAIAAVLRYRQRGKAAWREAAMTFAGNDRWSADISLERVGFVEYTVVAWIDHFVSWRDGAKKKHDAAVVEPADLQIGAALVAGAGNRAPDRSRNKRRLTEVADRLADETTPIHQRVALALTEKTAQLMAAYPDRTNASTYRHTLCVRVDRERAGFSAWYELFPRSCGRGTTHGTFADVQRHLPHIAEMGFDVVYLPPIHPIGVTKRKGRNNSLTPEAHDPGSPWAIGGAAGGHTAIHPELGTYADFVHLVQAAKTYQMEIALDIAFQCSPDHPWVTEHPEWFIHRPDGSVQYAENPPKKYEDIYPLDFETHAWESLWNTLLDVFLHWIEAGVAIFRVDNPHTKSFPFWEWLIDAVHRDHPDAIFLAEAFTRPKRMYRLAKAGFTHSYTYFTWRNSPGDLREYVTELTRGEAREFFRPNFWPNTPDILHEDLQRRGPDGHGVPAAFKVRSALAATLSSNYGLYGPAFELLEHEPVRSGSEEYANSEKYEIRDWDISANHSIAPFIQRINEIRRGNVALQQTRAITFHSCDNPHILCFSKTVGGNTILVCANMDYSSTQSGWVEFSPAAIARGGRPPFVVTDLLTDIAYTWRDYWNYVELDPERTPLHIFRLEP